MGPQSCQGDTLELQQGLKLKQITLFMCTATHIVLTFFSLTQQNQCLSLKPSFLCYRNCMCTCQAPMCTRNGSLCKRKCIKVPQEIYKGSVTPGGHVGTRLAKTLRTDCLLYDVLHDIDVENRGERSVEARGFTCPTGSYLYRNTCHLFKSPWRGKIPCRHASVNVS